MLKCDCRRHDSLASAQTSAVLQKRRHAASRSVESMVTARRTVPENELPEEFPEDEPRLSVPQSRRNVPEFVVTYPESTNPTFEGLRHTRSMGGLDQLAFSRPQRAHLPTVYENGVASNTIEDENLSSSTTRPHQMNHRRRTQDDDNHPRDLPFGSSSTEEENLSSSTTRLGPLARQTTHRRRNQDDDYHPRDVPFGTVASSSTTEEENLSSPTTRLGLLAHQRSHRRRNQDDDYHPRGNFTFGTAAEENINLRERTLNVPVAQSTPPSYKSVSGSFRRN